MKIKEVIVVEGRDDTIAIQQAVQADTIETGGSAINKEKLERIKLAYERRGVIVFTDPDYPGQRIRHIIQEAVPGCKHAFLPKEKAQSKQGKYGIEHASAEDIQEALKRVRTEELDEHSPIISWSHLASLGLVGGVHAKALREYMGRDLGIGYANAKQFYKRLSVFNITKEEFEKSYAKAYEEVVSS